MDFAAHNTSVHECLQSANIATVIYSMYLYSFYEDETFKV